MALWLPFLGPQVSGARGQCRVSSPGLGLPVCAAGRRDPARPGQLPRRPRWSRVCPDGVSWGDACSWARAGAGWPLRAGRLPARDTRLVSVRASRRPQGSAGRQVLQGGGFPAHPGRWEGVRGGPALLGLCQAPLLQVYSHRPVSSHLWGLAAPFPTGLRAPRGRARRGVQRPLPRQAAPGSGVAAPRQGAGTTFALQHCCDFSDPWCVGVLGLAGHVTDIQ